MRFFFAKVQTVSSDLKMTHSELRTSPYELQTSPSEVQILSVEFQKSPSMFRNWRPIEQ